MNDLADLLDREEFYDICQNFSNLTGLGVSLHKLDGSAVLTYRREDGACICSILGGDQRCVRNISFGAGKSAELGEPYIYICGCGLVMSASAIILDETLIGALLCGPAMLWDADDFAMGELEQNIAGSGLSIADCKKIVEGTPHFTCEQMTGASSILFRLVNYMCRSKNETIEQRREITKQQATISLLLADRKQGPAATRRTTGLYSPATEKGLLNAVRLGDRSAARGLLNDILADIFLWSGGNSSMICARVFELSGFLFRAASEAGAPGDKLLSIVRESQQILDPGMSIEDICYLTTRQMEGFIDTICENRPDIPGGRYLAGATAYLAEHYSDIPGLKLSDVADRLGISPSYLSHLFTNGLGSSFSAYVAKLRSEAAKDLLVNTGLSMSEIASQVGYDDPNYFIRSFKKNVGMTPKNFRRISAGDIGETERRQ